MDGITGPISPQLPSTEGPKGKVDTAFIQSMIEKTKQAGSPADGSFDKDMFLKILMTQLQNQSPFDTVETKEILEQQALLTQVEQTTKQTSTIEGLESVINQGFAQINATLVDIKGRL